MQFCSEVNRDWLQEWNAIQHFDTCRYNKDEEEEEVENIYSNIFDFMNTCTET